MISGLTVAWCSRSGQDAALGAAADGAGEVSAAPSGRAAGHGPVCEGDFGFALVDQGGEAVGGGWRR